MSLCCGRHRQCRPPDPEPSIYEFSDIDSFLKDHVTVLGEVEGIGEVRYLHGKRGLGTFTFYGGHDPEDYTQRVGDPPTDLSHAMLANL